MIMQGDKNEVNYRSVTDDKCSIHRVTDTMPWQKDSLCMCCFMKLFALLAVPELLNHFGASHHLCSCSSREQDNAFTSWESLSRLSTASLGKGLKNSSCLCSLKFPCLPSSNWIKAAIAVFILC